MLTSTLVDSKSKDPQPFFKSFGYLKVLDTLATFQYGFKGKLEF